MNGGRGQDKHFRKFVHQQVPIEAGVPACTRLHKAMRFVMDYIWSGGMSRWNYRLDKSNI
jgi:hypothetical protein